VDVGAIKEAAADPRFKNLMLTLAQLYKLGFRGRVTVDMNGDGELHIRSESMGGKILGDKLPRIVVVNGSE